MKIASEKYSRRAGLTLVELLVAASVMGMIAAAAAGLAQTVLDAHAVGTEQAALQRDGLAIMDRITSEIRRSTHVAIPNAHAPARNILAVSGRINDDYDFYFGDPLFPRIDEDCATELESDSASGLSGFDDDGDGSTDEGLLGLLAADDDEDGSSDEDPWNGLDDDGDGMIDEDPGSDMNNDGVAGIRGMDDDGDGSVDEGVIIFSAADDDEDGSSNEDGFNHLLYWQPNAGTLVEEMHTGGTASVLSSQVSAFEALWESPSRIRVSLTLANTRGEQFSLSEVACPRNVRQKTGKRVR